RHSITSTPTVGSTARGGDVLTKPHHPKPIVVSMVTRIGAVARRRPSILLVKVERSAPLHAGLRPFHTHPFRKPITLRPAQQAPFPHIATHVQHAEGPRPARIVCHRCCLADSAFIGVAAGGIKAIAPGIFTPIITLRGPLPLALAGQS